MTSILSSQPNDWLTALNSPTEVAELDMKLPDRVFLGRGIGERTLKFLYVWPTDCARGFYPDGQPLDYWAPSEGDGTVLEDATEIPGI